MRQLLRLYMLVRGLEREERLDRRSLQAVEQWKAGKINIQISRNGSITLRKA
jgi:hypothetical protein